MAGGGLKQQECSAGLLPLLRLRALLPRRRSMQLIVWQPPPAHPPQGDFDWLLGGAGGNLSRQEAQRWVAEWPDEAPAPREGAPAGDASQVGWWGAG